MPLPLASWVLLKMYNIGWKNCIHVLKKSQDIFPPTYYASMSQFCHLSFKHEFSQSENCDTQGIIQK